MNEIKEFIEAFFKIEATTSDAMLVPNLENYNRKLSEMNSFCIEEIKNTFGMTPMLSLESDEFYEDWKDTPFATLRHLFKITEYNNSKYGKLYAIYCSNVNPNPNKFRLFNCIFTSSIDGNLQIVKKYHFDDDSAMLNHKIWIEGLGLNDITFDTLGEFVKTERYLAPEHCEFSLADYNEDK